MSDLNGLGQVPGLKIFELHKTKRDPSQSVQSVEMLSARLGRLAIPGRKVLETPNFLAITSRGVIPHITPDVLLGHVKVSGIYSALEDYIEKAARETPPIIESSPTELSSPFHHFTALPPSVVTILGARRTPAVSPPNGSTENAISIFSSLGFQPLSVSSYVDYINAVRPDVAIGLADLSYGARPGVKKLARMGERTSKWLHQLIEGVQESAQSTHDNPTTIFAPVLPIDFHAQSEYIDHIADDFVKSLSGLAFYSADLLPEVSSNSSLSHLVRLSLDEPSSPQQILRQVSLGMDLFAIPFVGFTTDAGLALTFRFPAPTSISSNSMSNGKEAESLAIDLSDVSHATSLTPLAADCSCYACTSHHRAYINHLLSAKEMLGWVLLQIHNLHIMTEFFSSIREAIKLGDFEEKKKLFEAYYDSELPEGTGQRPRARGYQFKSEGPGEPKKNLAAWANFEENTNGSEEIIVPQEDSLHLEKKGFAETID